MISVKPPEKRALAVATTIAIIFGAYFLKHYVMLIIFAAIVAFMFNPFYQRLLKRGHGTKKAASLTLLMTFVAVIIPLILVVIITSFQIAHLVDSIKNAGQNTNINDLFNSIINSINHMLDSIGIPYKLSEATIRENLSTTLKTFGESILNSLAGMVSSIGRFISTFIIYIYVFISILVNQDKLLETFHQINPLGREISDLYAQRTAVMTKSMVRGQFVIATVQGFTDALFLYIAGFHSTFFFFFVLLTMLSIIPLGGGIIVIPLGVIMVLTGQVWQGLLVLAGHLLVVTNEDNVLRPRLVPHEARLDPALTLLSVFSGLAFFGFIGIVLGPVIMILIVTTVQVYLEVFKNVESIKKAGKVHGGRFDKIKFWKRKHA